MVCTPMDWKPPNHQRATGVAFWKKKQKGCVTPRGRAHSQTKCSRNVALQKRSDWIRFGEAMECYKYVYVYIYIYAYDVYMNFYEYLQLE